MIIFFAFLSFYIRYRTSYKKKLLSVIRLFELKAYSFFFVSFNYTFCSLLGTRAGKRQRKSAKPSRLSDTSSTQYVSQMSLSHWVLLVFQRNSQKSGSLLCLFWQVGYKPSRPLSSFSQNVWCCHTKKGVNSMIMSLIVTVILIVAGCLLLLQMYDVFESEFSRMIIVIVYCVFVIAMLFYWFFDNVNNII